MSYFYMSKEEFVKMHKDEARKKERARAIGKMIDKGYDKDIILSLNYTEEEYKEVLDGDV